MCGYSGHVNTELHTTICTLARELEAAMPLPPNEAIRIIKDYAFEAGHFASLSDPTYPPDHNYGRHILYASKNLEIMLMTWRPGAFSAIHDHGEIDFGAVMVFEEMTHHIYRFEPDHLSLFLTETLRPGTVLAVLPNSIHQMGNAGEKPVFSLHIYGSHAPTQQVAASSRIYDVEHNRIIETHGGAFFDLPEQEYTVMDQAMTTTPAVKELQAPILSTFRGS